MTYFARPRLVPAILTLCLLSTPPLLSAQTQTTAPASFDPDPLLHALADADASQAEPLLDKLTDDQFPVFLAAFNPEKVRDDARTAILLRIHSIVRRVWAGRRKRDVAAEHAWLQRTGLPVYKSAGQRNPKWDAAAIDALSTDDSITPEQSAKKFKAALDAGCTDPLVRYYYIRRSLMVKTLAPADAFAAYMALLPDFEKSPYSTCRKFQLRIQILRLAIDNPGFPNAHATAEQMFQSAVNALPLLAAEKCGFVLLQNAVELLEFAGPKLGHPIEADFHRISPTLPALFPGHVFPCQYESRFYVAWAWKARGSGWANTVTDDGWKLFRERLLLAEKAATAGVALDPLDTKCAAEMITVSMGLSYDRPVMEKWFERSMLPSPNLEACERKSNYLLPRWGGSEKDELEFGHQCLRDGTASDRIPIMLLNIHRDLARDVDDQDAYLAQPEVWADIDAVYKKFLADEKTEIAQNNLRLDRAEYIQYAYKCHQWKTVLDLMDQFKDEVDFNIIGGKAVYNFYRKNAAQQLAAAPI